MYIQKLTYIDIIIRLCSIDKYIGVRIYHNKSCSSQVFYFIFMILFTVKIRRRKDFIGAKLKFQWQNQIIVKLL